MPKENAHVGVNRISRQHGARSQALLVIAIAWVVGFSIWFYSFGMPNHDGITRHLLWANLPFTLLDLIDPPVERNKPDWSWLFLLERLPYLAVAALIWTGAWGIGSLALRIAKVRLRGCENLFFSMCVGLSLVSLTVLALGLCGLMSSWILAGIFLVTAAIKLVLRKRTAQSGKPTAVTQSTPGFGKLDWVLLVCMMLFVVGQLIGSMTPQNDFDVIEYHLGGPKEWFQLGQIQRLPHNVYTNFPFLCEMILLAGMVIYGDWQWGALGGQAALAIFAPLTALGLFAAGHRWFSRRVGLIAALVYLSSPWTYRITIIAYAESALACYLFAALFAFLLLRHALQDSAKEDQGNVWSLTLLTGMLAGSGMACKYTGLVSVVIPIIGLLLFASWNYIKAQPLPRTTRLLCAFAIGLGLTIGPWLLKNFVMTGNPVYPLGVRIFGGIDRDPEIDTKWRNGHAAKSYPSWQARMADLPIKVQDVVAKNDWHSGLMFAFAPLSLLLLRLVSRRNSTAVESDDNQRASIIRITWLYVGWQFATWWLLTHHIDRFYVPMFSVVALLAGVGACWWESLPSSQAAATQPWPWSVTISLTIGAAILFNANLMQTGICGFNAGRLHLRAAGDIAISSTTPRLRWMHDSWKVGDLPSDLKVLYAGEAALFHACYPYLYNTVFDHSILERICVKPGSITFELKPAEEIQAELRRLGITHVDVCWSEILRYREPGSYGYTDFVTPERFVELQKLGVLGPPLSLPEWANRIPLSPSRTQQIEKEGWMNQLGTRVNDEPAYFSSQIFPVLPSDSKEARH